MLGREPGGPWDYHRRPHIASSVWPPDQSSNRAAIATRSHNKKHVDRHTSPITVNPPHRQDEDAAPLPPDVKDARDPSAPESEYARLIHGKADNDGHDSSSANGHGKHPTVILYCILISSPYLNPRYHWHSLSCPVCSR